MRLSLFLFAAAATLLAKANTVEAAVTAPDLSNSIDLVQNNIVGSRSLRIRVATDADDSDDEERAGLESLESILKSSATLEAKANQLIAKNKELFQQVEAIIGTPYQLRQRLGIPEKVKIMTGPQLDKDMDYHFWLAYSKWYKGTYGKDR
ncbi:hypothetical protein KRP22_012703 [Phytophthora ramorum]|nr:hypothetical protein KRP22_12899 [Phytophthora ramorum]